MNLDNCFIVIAEDKQMFGKISLDNTTLAANPVSLRGYYRLFKSYRRWNKHQKKLAKGRKQ